MAKTTISNVNSRKKPNRKTHYVPINQDLADQIEDIQEELAEMRGRLAVSGGSEFFQESVDRLCKQKDDLVEQLKDPKNSIKFVFQSIGPRRYDKLITASQFTEERKEEVRAQGDDPDKMSFDVRLFSPKVIAASCIEPEGLTEQYVSEEMLEGENWTSGELTDLYGAALEVNLRQRDLRLGKESASTPS